MRIYVGNLAFSAREDELSTLFSEFGKVGSAKIIADKYTGRSKGFGFVDMEDDTAAINAIETLNGKEFQGRNLKVSEARPMQEGGGTRSFQPRGGR